MYLLLIRLKGPSHGHDWKITGPQSFPLSSGSFYGEKIRIVVCYAQADLAEMKFSVIFVQIIDPHVSVEWIFRAGRGLKQWFDCDARHRGHIVHDVV